MKEREDMTEPAEAVSDRSYGYKGNNRRGGSYQTAPKAEPVTETVSESAQE